MTKQKYVFLEDEGDRWFERNREGLQNYDAKTDPVVAAISKLDLKPKRVLEFGCGDGRRLAALRDQLGCDIMGVEPSREAGLAAASRRVPVVQCTASSAAVQTPFDLVIYGFCLYLTDPEDWLTIAAEGNTVLSPGGHLIVHDFLSRGDEPYARPYEHRDGILSYHFDFAQLWLGHPLYEQVSRANGATTTVVVLRKLPINSIPVKQA